MDLPDKCVLCQHSQSTKAPSIYHLTKKYTCPRCGEYILSELLYESRAYLFRSGFFQLACVAHEWHLRHPHTAFVLTDDAKLSPSVVRSLEGYRIYNMWEMLDSFPKGHQIIDRALLNLAQLVSHPMDCLVIQPHEHKWALFCQNEDGALRMLRYMSQMGYVTADDSAIDVRGVRYSIAPGGWARIQALADTQAESGQGFAAMWFNSAMDSTWKEGIRPAMKAAGYAAKRIDNVEHNNKVDDEIVAEIRKSRFVVADFTAGYCQQCATCEKRGTTEHPCHDMYRARGGVYFEAGLAMGLGIPVIWTAQENQEKQIHFDTRQYNHIFYKDAEDLKERLKNRIEATIGHGPVADGDDDEVNEKGR
jgi:hypothetical protein